MRRVGSLKPLPRFLATWTLGFALLSALHYLGSRVFGWHSSVAEAFSVSLIIAIVGILP